MFLTKQNKIKWKFLLTAAIVVFGLVLSGIFFLDVPLFLFFRQFNSNVWPVFASVFDAKVWLVLSGLFAGVFYLKKAIKSNIKYRNDRNQISLIVFFKDCLEKTKTNYAFLIFCSVFSASLLALGLKALFGRARPLFFEALDLVGFFPLSTEWAFHSLPSGHTTASFAGLVMLGLLVPKYKAITWTLAIVIGVSRICVGAHWPSDVLLGAFIGMVVADFVKCYFNNQK